MFSFCSLQRLCFCKFNIIKVEPGRSKAKWACWLVSQGPTRRLTKGELVRVSSVRSSISLYTSAFLEYSCHDVFVDFTTRLIRHQSLQDISQDCAKLLANESECNWEAAWSSDWLRGVFWSVRLCAAVSSCKTQIKLKNDEFRITSLPDVNKSILLFLGPRDCVILFFCFLCNFLWSHDVIFYCSGSRTF